MPQDVEQKVIVGLGNPGSQYNGTRHNVGYAVIDRLAHSPRAGSFRNNKFQAQVASLEEDGFRLLLVKPETFMNLSGRSVRQLMDFYQLPLTNLLVVCDDINLPLGKLRFRSKGSHGGHNGLRNIQEHVGTQDYARLRIGVDAPGSDAIDHVLGRFRPGERPVIEEAIQTGVQAAVLWVQQGIATAMNRYNGG